ncbi:MAG: hypothetical protein ACI85F_003086, partial [Bacteroidia bacterium]
ARKYPSIIVNTARWRYQREYCKMGITTIFAKPKFNPWLPLNTLYYHCSSLLLLHLAPN